MSQSLSDYRVFWRQFRENFHTTGAVLPSGRFLAAALASCVRQSSPTPRRVLEVGPGTGAVTGAIVSALGAQDTFDLVELNDQFVARLRERFASEPAWLAVAPRARVLHARVETLLGEEPYDAIISGLPLNNFAVQDVEQILAVLAKLLKPGGTLSFFEYIGIRRMKSVTAAAAERERLRGISDLLGALLRKSEIRRDRVMLNVLPAWVHHCQNPQ